METWKDLMDTIGYWINEAMTDKQFNTYIHYNKFEDRAMPLVNEFRRVAKKKGQN